MALAARHRDTLLPTLPGMAGLRIHRERSARAMALVQGKPEIEMQRRFGEGHRAYVATLDGEPAAFGWVATSSARIGELAATVTLPAGDRYLWNFVTMPRFRGRGIYPRLLEAIVRAESRVARRFWIVYAPENHASGAGIGKAGFTTVADLSFDAQGRPALRPLGAEVARVIARVFQVPQVDAPLAPCWRCVRAGASPAHACRAGHCHCDYQRPELGCAG
jgi:GNAT superfamily N-acetyltransferase